MKVLILICCCKLFQESGALKLKAVFPSSDLTWGTWSMSMAVERVWKSPSEICSISQIMRKLPRQGCVPMCQFASCLPLREDHPAFPYKTQCCESQASPGNLEPYSRVKDWVQELKTWMWCMPVNHSTVIRDRRENCHDNYFPST